MSLDKLFGYEESYWIRFKCNIAFSTESDSFSKLTFVKRFKDFSRLGLKEIKEFSEGTLEVFYTGDKETFCREFNDIFEDMFDKKTIQNISQYLVFRETEEEHTSMYTTNKII